MTLIHVVVADLKPQGLQHAYAADTKDDFLFQAVGLITTGKPLLAPNMAYFLMLIETIAGGMSRDVTGSQVQWQSAMPRAA